jgi:hypothetical protein
MTYFVELLKGWRGHKKSEVLMVGKSTANSLVNDKTAIRVGDPSKIPPEPKKKKKKKTSWGR